MTAGGGAGAGAPDAAPPLRGQAMLVTGAGVGLAPRIARAAAQRGARVHLATPEGCEDAAAPGVTHVSAPLASEAEADRLLEGALEDLSRLEVGVLVVAAEPPGALHELALEGWQECVADPLRRTFWLAQRVLEEFLAAQGGGRLVLVVDPRPDPAAGAGNEVVEEALASFARSVAREYGRRAVACSVVLPAPGAAPPGGDPLAAMVELALFLASPAASFVSGEVVAAGGAP